MGLPKLYTVAEVAEALGKRVDTVLSMIHAGDLEASNLSRTNGRPSWRIHPDSFMEYLNQRSNRANQQAKKPSRRIRKPKKQYI